MSFSFFYPDKETATVTVTLPNPERDNPQTLTRGQVLGRTRGGQRRVYRVGAGRTEAEFEFAHLTNGEKNSLQSFFTDSADGMAVAFQVQDHHGLLWDAWFAEDTLAWVNIGEQQPPDTDPLWSIRLRLEMSLTVDPGEGPSEP